MTYLKMVNQVVKNLPEVLRQLNQREEADLIDITYLEKYPDDKEVSEMYLENQSDSR